MSITKEAVIKLLGDRPVAYHPILARVLKGVNEAVFISQLLYWYGKGKKADNWIYKTMAEWEEETGLTRSNQQTARRNLIKLGVLEYKLKEVPAKGHYKLNIDRLVELLSLHDSDNVQTVQTGLHDSDNLDCANPPNLIGASVQSIPENTPENTPGNLSLREQAQNGEMTPETEAALLCGFGRQGKQGVADPSQDNGQWIKYRDKAVQAVLDITKVAPNESQIAAISELAEQSGFDLELWKTSIHSCQLSRIKPGNVACYLDTYAAGGNYVEMQRAKRNGGTKRASNDKRRVQGSVPEYSVADPAAFHDQRPDDATG